ncbi:hypothetical protein [Stackebrandtia soli]|uniref:hypothetical protein n=1 Tax=Stackebrandtia soli TaxID=1892856 RepID=UPI0039ED95B7
MTDETPRLRARQRDIIFGSINATVCYAGMAATLTADIGRPLALGPVATVALAVISLDNKLNRKSGLGFMTPSCA